MGAIYVGGIRSKAGGSRRGDNVTDTLERVSAPATQTHSSFSGLPVLTVFLLLLLPAVIYLFWSGGGSTEPPLSTIEGIKMNDNHVITRATSQRRKFLLL